MKLKILIILLAVFPNSFGQQVHVNIGARMDQFKVLEDGTSTHIWGYGIISSSGNLNTRIPGPHLEFNLGDTVNIHFFNPSPENHTIHLHGLDVSQVNDGVPTTSFSAGFNDTVHYSFVADHTGSFLYHCHVLTTLHLTMGMYGMIIVRDTVANRLYDNGPTFNKSYHYLSSDMDRTWNDNPISIPPFYEFKANYFMLNGESGTQLLSSNNQFVEAYPGDTTLLSLANMAYSQVRYIFPPELNAIAYQSDGRPLPNPFHCDTLVINSGERFSVLFTPTTGTDELIEVQYFEARNGLIEHSNFIVLNTELSIGEEDKETISVFPNPTSGQINIVNLKENDRISIIDINGRLMLSTVSNGNEIQLNINNLSNGIYLLKVNDSIHKIVVNK